MEISLMKALDYTTGDLVTQSLFGQIIWSIWPRMQNRRQISSSNALELCSPHFTASFEIMRILFRVMRVGPLSPSHSNERHHHISGTYLGGGGITRIVKTVI